MTQYIRHSCDAGGNPASQVEQECENVGCLHDLAANMSVGIHTSASSSLKRGDKLLACLSASIRRFASWKLATTFLRSQEIRLEDALGANDL
jgi:hypothetical protein